MKKRTTSKSFILLAISMLFFTAPLIAQKRPTTSKEDIKKSIPNLEEEKVPFYQGLNIGVDLLGIGSKLFGGNTFSTEVSLEANIKNRYMPVIEVGYAQVETTHEDTSIYYKTAAPYFRVGANYNIMFKKPYLPGFLFVGARIGHTSFSYDVATLGVTDPVWGHTTIPIAYQNVKSNATWGEFVVGLRTEIVKNLCLGFSARFKFPFSIKKTTNSEPWYVPGYGTTGSSTIGLTYNISYNLPF